MKGFFGVFNDTIFQLDDPTDISSSQFTSNDIETGVDLTVNPSDSRVCPYITISNIGENMISNKEFFDNIVLKIQEEDIKSIQRLAPIYRISLDYQLYDRKANRVLDEGIVTKTVDGSNSVMPLGLDAETNELVYRVIKDINGSISFVYNERVPYGIMDRKPTDIYLYINRIQLQQCVSTLTDDTVSVRMQRPAPFCKPCDHHAESKRNPHTKHGRLFGPNYVIMYDSVGEGLEFKPIKIKFSPRKITVGIRLVLNNYVITSDTQDILSYVDENNKADEPTDVTPENPDTGDDTGTTTDPETPDTGDDSGTTTDPTTPDEGTGDGTTDETTDPTDPVVPDEGNTDNGGDTSGDISADDNTDSTDDTTNGETSDEGTGSDDQVDPIPDGGSVDNADVEDTTTDDTTTPTE